MNAARCRHCGEPLDAAAVTDAQGAPSWCCHGCASAANFIEAIEGRAAALNTSEQALRLMQVIDAIYASATTGKPVSI